MRSHFLGRNLCGLVLELEGPIPVSSFSSSVFLDSFFFFPKKYISVYLSGSGKLNRFNSSGYGDTGVSHDDQLELALYGTGTNSFGVRLLLLVTCKHLFMAAVACVPEVRGRGKSLNNVIYTNSSLPNKFFRRIFFG